MLRPAVQHGHQTVVHDAVHHLQPHVPGVRDTGDGSDRKRARDHPLPLGPEHSGQGQPPTTVHDTPVDLRRHHQTAAVPDTDCRYHITGNEHDIRFVD